MNNFQKIIENKNKEQKVKNKTLPNSFDSNEGEITLGKSILMSLVLHPAVIIVAWLMVTVLTLAGLMPNELSKPHLKTRDIEFVLVNKEGEPINKNTKNRSDRNSQAGGHHDPTRKVVEPSPAGPKTKPAKKPVQPKAGGGIGKQIAQALNKAQAPKTQPAQQSQSIAKPKPAYAPKPTAKPTASSGPLTRPQMPKITQNPKSPFSVSVPKTNLPQGPIPSTSNGTARYGGQGGGTTSGTGNRVASMPSPQFSKGTGTGYGTGKGTGVGNGTGSGYGTGRGTGTSGGGGQGGYGTGGWGNPGPGNPKGTPGIDAIKQADWGPYMRELERRIKRNWNPPKGDTSKRVVMLFTIGRDGRLISVKTLKSSGSPESDRAAKAAIELTAPFKSLPPEFKGNNVDIEFTFDYNVLGARNYR